MKQHDAAHYRELINSDINASLGCPLAAAAVYAARFGACGAAEHYTNEWREIARDLKARYGENLNAGDVLREMDVH